MKVHELIKIAVEEQDWIKVCTAYTAITGKPLSPPKKKVSLLDLDIPEGLLEEVEASRNDEDEYEDEYEDIPREPSYHEDDPVDEPELLEESPPIPDPVEEQESKKKDDEHEFSISHGVQGQKASSDGNGTIMRKVPLGGQKHSNRFKDNLAVEAGDLKKNNPILKKVYSKAGTRQARSELVDRPDTSKLYKVQCSLCDKVGNVTAMMARGYNKDPEQNRYRCTECDTPTGRSRLARRERDLG